jgi:hypothetical protein
VAVCKAITLCLRTTVGDAVGESVGARVKSLAEIVSVGAGVGVAVGSNVGACHARGLTMMNHPAGARELDALRRTPVGSSVGAAEG